MCASQRPLEANVRSCAAAFANGDSASIACARRMRNRRHERAAPTSCRRSSSLGRVRGRGAPPQLHRAADEIALTQSAVSRQIQALEERLGVPLFRRLHRALRLTEEGQTLYQRASSRRSTPLDRASARSRRASARDRRRHHDAGLRRPLADPAPDRASSPPIPRSTCASRPATSSSTSSATASTSAIRYRPREGVPASTATAVRRDRLSGLQPAPAARRRSAPLKMPADLRRHTLLHMEPDGGNQLQDWAMWLHAMKLAEPEARRACCTSRRTTS